MRATKRVHYIQALAASADGSMLWKRGNVCDGDTQGESTDSRQVREEGPDCGI